MMNEKILIGAMILLAPIVLIEMFLFLTNKSDLTEAKQKRHGENIGWTQWFAGVIILGALALYGLNELQTSGFLASMAKL